MIVSFGHKQTEKIWKDERVKKLPPEIQHIGRRKLRMINNAVDLQDLSIPPTNRLEKLIDKEKTFTVSASTINSVLFFNGKMETRAK